MDPEIKQALLFMGKKIESMEDKLDAIADKLDELREDIPPDMDVDLSEIKAILVQQV